MNSELLEKIKIVAPGTKLRKALDDIILGNLGALIVLVKEEDLKLFSNIFQGGFKIDVPFTPERLYELAKMDGALIIDENVSRIYMANVHLVPDSTIPTIETGTRHRTAERVAKQTQRLVIAVSKRRNVITLYYKDTRHVLQNTNLVLTVVGQTMSTLEHFREILEKHLLYLDLEERKGKLSLLKPIELILRGCEIKRIAEEVFPLIYEIGQEGKLALLRMREVLRDLDHILQLIIMDYSKNEITEEQALEILENLKNTDQKVLAVAKILGYEFQNVNILSEYNVSPRGYRMLNYVAHIPMSISQNVIKRFNKLSNILNSSVETLKQVDGIGEKRAKTILKTLKKTLKEK